MNIHKIIHTGLLSAALALVALICASPAAGQTTPCLTTLNGAVNISSTTVVVNNASCLVATNVVVIDRETMFILAISTNTLTVTRSYFNTPATSHASGTVTWGGPASYFINMDASGSCTASQVTALPAIVSSGFTDQVGNGWSCPNGVWVLSFSPTPTYNTDWVVTFGPGNCAWSTTGTTTGTNGLTVAGASVLGVNQVQVSSAGASVNTLTCTIPYPTRLTNNRGAWVKDIEINYGVQTTALTSINGAAISTIAMPTPGASETPSTVTPVSAGSVTQSSTTGNLATTTAGAFYTSQILLGTQFALTVDHTALVVTLNFNQAASAAQIVNTPGGLMHLAMSVI